MEADKQNRIQMVYDDVSKSVQDQSVRELWYRLKSELIRDGGGPDACIAYLEGELARMSENTKRALDWLS